MSGHRQAALALHGLSRNDQDKILAELPFDDQQRLRAYLAELTELGFDAPLQDAVKSGLFARTVPDTPRARLQAASASDMAALLAPEPAALAAQVLRLGDWPWTAEFLLLLPGPRRVQVQAAAAAVAAPAPERARFLLDAVAAKLAPPASGLPAPLSGLMNKVGAWMR